MRLTLVRMIRAVLCCLTFLAVPAAFADTNVSTWVYPGASGRLQYGTDARGNRLLDYSAVGYKGGTAPIPNVPVKLTISPIAGDDGANIQNAINQVSALPLDPNGFRGALLLTAGEYDISNSITLGASGIVLRGVGDSLSGTILRATGTNQRTLVSILGAGSAATVSGTTHNITNNYVPVGARSFDVDSTSGLAAGDRVYVRRTATDDWIQFLGMDLLCCPPESNPWTASGYNMDSERMITRIEGNRIMLDAPLTCAIEAVYAGGTIRKITWAGRINNVGIEDIRGVSDYAASDDEAHGWTFIDLRSVENAWVQRVTSQYFGFGCVAQHSGTRGTTVRDCKSLDPISIITGSRRYAFNLDDAQYCLVQNCYTLKDRHQFVTGSLTIGPNVFVDGLSDTAYSDAGPHHRWATGAIWDNITVNGNNLNIQNRGNLGTGHGWAGGNEVAWNCDADGGFVVQNPPGAHNWLIGSIGTIENGTSYVGPHDPGTYDKHGANVFPNSLYYAQLQEKMAAATTDFREYAVGEINNFSSATATGTVVNVDAAWQTAIQGIAGVATLCGFDRVATNQIVPFTFDFNLGADEQILAASLTLAMRAPSTRATNERLYLDSTGTVLTFSNLAWQPLATGTNASVRVLDLGNYLNLLTDGKLNLAIADDVGVDWATLQFQVAPVQTTFTKAILPNADTFARSGVNAGLSYGTNTTLDVKNENAGDNVRRAYLRWNLAGLSERVVHARIRLMPVSVGTNGLEHGATLASVNQWNENTLNWNNQPGGGKRFATWIPVQNAPAEFVVTPQVQAALAGDGQLALQIFSLKNVGGAGGVSYASSDDPNPALRPQLLLVVSNDVPVISSLADKTISTNTSTGPIAFTIGDASFAVNTLTLGAFSSNTNLVPSANLLLGGSLSNRTLTVTPLANQIGTAFITVVVTNPVGRTAGAQFLLSVTNGSGVVPPLTPANGTWIVDANGDWNNPANWASGIIATGVNFTATFNANFTAPRFVNLGPSLSIGNLSFIDSNPTSAGSVIITNGTITLQVASGTPSLSATDITGTINSALAGSQGLTKTGPGTVVLGGANTYSGTTTLSAGALRATHNNALGSASGSSSIGNAADARLELAGNVTIGEAITIACKAAANGNVPAVVNVSGTNTLSGTLSLTTGGSYWTFEAAGGKLRVIGAVNNITTVNARTIWLRGTAAGELISVIGDSAAAFATNIRKDDTGVWTMAGNNIYSGSTTVSNGTLLVTGTVRGSGVDIYEGVLAGSGLITAPVTMFPGSFLTPGTSIGTLTISNTLTLIDGSQTTMEINAQTLARDFVTGLSNVTYGGTLVISNVAGTLSAGQSFKLFSATSASGNFNGVIPPPGAGLAWSFNPANGTLSVLSVAPPQIISSRLAGGSFTMSGTGPTGQPYRILAATNLGNNWTPIATGTFSGGTFLFTDPQTSNYLRRFFRVTTP